MNPAHWRIATRQAFFHCSTFGTALCLALLANATARYQAVLLGGNYAGGLALDDNPSLSALAIAKNLDRSNNGSFGRPLGNIALLPQCRQRGRNNRS